MFASRFPTGVQDGGSRPAHTIDLRPSLSVLDFELSLGVGEFRG